MEIKQEFIYNSKILEIHFPVKIDFMISNFLAEVLDKNKVNEIDRLILNLSGSKFITLPAVVFIICFSGYLKRFKNPYLETRIAVNSDKIISYLVNVGFFTQMNVYANLIVSYDLLNMEKNIRSKKFKENNISSNSSILFPISVIPENIGERHFEEYSRSFVYHFNNFFFELSKNYKFGFSNTSEESQELFGSLYENIKNIYDHSGTIGFGAIHSSLMQAGTVITFFDFGHGIINTVLDSGKFDSTNRIDAFYWALENGHSSKKEKGNQGLGFTIIKNFVKKKNGILTIRTDKYLLNFRNGVNQPLKCFNYFPGTQIVLYVPINIKE
ncbi:MAG: hypothetical protein ABI462_04595 [Ignavibacteria bacterium]